MKRKDKIYNLIKIFLRENKLDQYLTKKYLDYFLVIFSILLGFYLNWGMQNIVVFSVVIWVILNPVSSQILSRITLGFIIFTPFLLILKREGRSEQTAIFAYYFLVLTIITAITEQRRKKKNEEVG